MQKKWIGLLDCNNFFVSCERLFRPDLVGKPVMVLSSNDGCVIARSQEVKDMGIPMGVPYFQIKDIVKKQGITTFSSHLALYRDISRRVFSVMQKELHAIDQYSIDEAFFTLNDVNPTQLVTALKSTIEQEVGIPVSIGVARTKTLAKYANTIAKKNTGVFCLDAAQWDTLNNDVKLSSVWGVGGNNELKYKQHGMVFVGDLIQADTARIAKIFGIHGVRLQSELQGVPAIFTDSIRPQKQSIMSSRSFKNTTEEYAVVADAVAYHVRHIAAELRAANQTAQEIRVAIRPGRHSDFFMRGGSLFTALHAPTNDSIVLMQTAHTLLKELFEAGVPYKKAGVTLSRLQSDAVTQPGLFDTDVTSKNTKLMQALDFLNSKQTKESVLLGSQLQSAGWRSQSDSRSPRYTTAWNDIAIVRAK
jgi:DNA polymerase V